MQKPEVRQALLEIAAQHAGMLFPADVVKAAEEETSPLHRYFTWDDSKAAYQYRLDQARGLIRVTVEYSGPSDKAQLERVFVSLGEDRTSGGGYRSLVEVMTDETQRTRLLEQALREAYSFQKRYRELAELAGVFAAMQKLEEDRNKAA